MMNRFYLLLALLAPAWQLPGSLAQTFQECMDPDIADECLARNRTCVSIVDVNGTADDEFCFQCINGTIPDFRTPGANLSTVDCFSIQDVTWQDFRDRFEPLIDENGVVEVAERLVILLKLLRFISAHNAQFPPPNFFLGLNHLLALTSEEIRKRNGYQAQNGTGLPDFFADNGGRFLQSLPLQVDWVSAGAVTPIVDQGQCGGCWSIAAVGAVEGAAAIDTNFSFLEPLSFQQLLSCDTENSGCNGGNTASGLQYIQTNSFGGVTGSYDYPFEDSSGTTSSDCTVNKDILVVVADGPRQVTSTDSGDSFSNRVTKMKQALAQQPVAIAINANCSIFQSYSSGIVTTDGSCSCGTVSCLDHAVLLVGYDDTTSPPNWKIKNSWGEGWGESGYIRVSQEQGGDFGLFGMLAEGVLPRSATNNTAVSFSSVDNASWGKTSLMAGIAGMLFVVW